MSRVFSQFLLSSKNCIEIFSLRQAFKVSALITALIIKPWNQKKCF